MGVLVVNVPVHDPETGQVVVLLAGTTAPAWAHEQITNPDVWDQGTAGEEGSDPDLAGGKGLALDPPPLTGAGSGRAAWAAYAEQLGVPVDADMTRQDIIVAVTEATSA